MTCKSNIIRSAFGIKVCSAWDNASYSCADELQRGIICMTRNVILFGVYVNCQTPRDELKWVRNAAEEDTVVLASRRGMVVCIACNNDKVQCSFCN